MKYPKNYLEEIIYLILNFISMTSFLRVQLQLLEMEIEIQYFSIEYL